MPMTVDDTKQSTTCGKPWQADNMLRCQLPKSHSGMHWSKGTWSTGGEVEMWWDGIDFEEDDK